MKFVVWKYNGENTYPPVVASAEPAASVTTLYEHFGPPIFGTPKQADEPPFKKSKKKQQGEDHETPPTQETGGGEVDGALPLKLCNLGRGRLSCPTNALIQGVVATPTLLAGIT